MVERLAQLRGHRLDLLRLCEIGRDDAAVELGVQPIEAVAARSVAPDGRAGVRQPALEHPADAGRAAGHKGDLARQ